MQRRAYCLRGTDTGCVADRQQVWLGPKLDAENSWIEAGTKRDINFGTAVPDGRSWVVESYGAADFSRLALIDIHNDVAIGSVTKSSEICDLVQRRGGSGFIQTPITQRRTEMRPPTLVRT